MLDSTFQPRLIDPSGQPSVAPVSATLCNALRSAVSERQHFLPGTPSLSILGHEPNHAEPPVIALENSNSSTNFRRESIYHELFVLLLSKAK